MKYDKDNAKYGILAAGIEKAYAKFQERANAKAIGQDYKTVFGWANEPVAV